MKKNTPNQQVPTVAIAIMVLTIAVVGFVALMSVVIPGAFMMIAAIAGLAGLFVAQYFIWGKWLYSYVIKKEHEAQLSREPASATDAESGTAHR